MNNIKAKGFWEGKMMSPYHDALPLLFEYIFNLTIRISTYQMERFTDSQRVFHMSYKISDLK